MKNRLTTADSSDKRRSDIGTWASAAMLSRCLGRAMEPHILFPLIAVFMLSAIWGTSLLLINNARAAAEHTAALSSRELAVTYEAQVMRALREIDQTLKLVKYAVELMGKQAVLQELKAKALLPPDLLFVVSIADSKGNIVASSRAPAMTNVANQDYFESQLLSDEISVGRSHLSAETGEWKLEFSRRLSTADEKFAGIVVLSVDAAYFVSGYEPSKLGEHGLLGLIGTDGVFRVRRSGETVSAGDTLDYTAIAPAAKEMEAAGILSTNPWDGVPRYTSATTQIYGFPLAVIVGLSADEQLQPTRNIIHSYLWWSTLISLMVTLVIAALGRMSHQLALSRQRVVEEHIAHAARVEYLAYHDGLTTLPNRSLFSKLLSQSINQARRYNRQQAVLFLDLDHFKRVNDTMGHDAGDQLLQEVAARLKTCLRESDIVARLGGDEFVILLPELDVEKYAATVAQKILAATARPFVLLGQEFRVTASIGISIYPHDGLDEQTLTKNADIAMYQAKEGGKNIFKFYSEEMNAHSLERLALESELRHALEHDEFQLYYQAKQDIRSGRITGMEALLRWQHPDLGTVAPMQFIPLAEETGLIIPIGKWVLRSACLQNVTWQRQGLPHMLMAVNLTARQFFDGNLRADLMAILADTGMDAHLLELEIAESLLMSDVAKALQILIQLKNMGIQIAIDDFGVGYSSLAALKQFPLNTVKIDRSFIRDVASASEDKDMTKAIITMGRMLSLTVVAQGVETKEQAEYLRENSCDEFQGFYLNKPVPADQMTELLRTQKREDTDTNPAA